jgi:signal transduction histidine kinase
MGRMIEDMLDLARARLAGGIVVKRETTDFKLLLERVIREHQAAAPERSIKTVYRGDFSGSFDAERISQVASNLIGNALKHGDGGTVDVELDGTTGGSVTLNVSNGGMIPADLIDHLFDPFRGGQRPAGRNAGLGLGLYIVYQIVKAHHGSVRVDTSREGRTTFRVDLPRFA